MFSAWILWYVTQILYQNWVACCLSWWWYGQWLFELSPSSGLTFRQTHCDAPWEDSLNLIAASCSQIRAWALTSNWSKSWRVLLGLELLIGLSEASFSIALYFNFPCPILHSLNLPLVSWDPPTAHKSWLHGPLPWAWSLSLPFLLEKHSSFSQFPLSSVFSLCLNRPYICHF